MGGGVERLSEISNTPSFKHRGHGCNERRLGSFLQLRAFNTHTSNRTGPAETQHGG